MSYVDKCDCCGESNKKMSEKVLCWECGDIFNDDVFKCLCCGNYLKGEIIIEKFPGGVRFYCNKICQISYWEQSDYKNPLAQSVLFKKEIK